MAFFYYFELIRLALPYLTYETLPVLLYIIEIIPQNLPTKNSNLYALKINCVS